MNWSPEKYLAAAVVAREAGDELLSRLDLLMKQPKVIVAGGCMAEQIHELENKYAQAKITNLNSNPFNISHTTVCTESSVDMLIANMLIPYLNEPQKTFTQWRSKMSEEGILIFSALGPDSLKEYRAIVGDALPHLHDMHDIGDLLIQCGFSDPVLDVNYITLNYQDQKKMLHELYASGILMQGIDASLLPANPPWEMTFEMIYGHAFAPAETNTAQVSSDGNAYFPLHKIGKRTKS